ncbi:hypothetical protein HX109_06550 [Galbibacter sp. BG1]|nr:hypothetical protein [Galbibacter sp. BG1]QLE01240.1 hypothetical protein HX109_06550 [Galbibacter sp. BG1]
MLIIAYCLKAGKTFKNSCNWAKYITDWHEKAFKNSELAEAMDLHNNAVGRAIMKEEFQHKKLTSIEKVVILLLKEVKKAKYIERINDLKSAEKSLVFIEYI